MPDRDKLVKRNFSSAEQGAYNALPDSEREAAFYAIWTRKEAVLKASGLGLHMPLDAFDVPHLPLKDWLATGIDDSELSERDYVLKDVTAPPNYSAAIALTAIDAQKPPHPELIYFNYESD